MFLPQVAFPGQAGMFFHDALVHNDRHSGNLSHTISFLTHDPFLNPDAGNRRRHRFPDNIRNIRSLSKDHHKVRCHRKAFQIGITGNMRHGAQVGIDRKNIEAMVLKVAGDGEAWTSELVGNSDNRHGFGVGQNGFDKIIMCHRKGFPRVIRLGHILKGRIGDDNNKIRHDQNVTIFCFNERPLVLVMLS